MFIRVPFFMLILGSFLILGDIGRFRLLSKEWMIYSCQRHQFRLILPWPHLLHLLTFSMQPMSVKSTLPKLSSWIVGDDLPNKFLQIVILHQLNVHNIRNSFHLGMFHTNVVRLYQLLRLIIRHHRGVLMLFESCVGILIL